MRDGLPIALGYFAVAFTLGIAARNAGLGPLHGLVSSLLVNASAGQYAGYAMIAADATLWEMAAMILVANARYFLMSCALSQKFSPETPFYHRLLVGFDVTDELFGLAIAQEGWLPPVYMYGAMMLAMPGWASGTALGIAAGSVLPARLVSALSVAIYGMFIAVIIPPARKDRIVGVFVALSFLFSWLFSVLPLVRDISEGLRTILLTVLLASAAAVLFPVKDEGADA
ncbi:MAG: AzlC family ABC transporter permease [Ruminococcaceae bacterium]|nr:AzlC family ABC transporter permease [Oscillospiraceae bacterium]